MLKKFLSYYRPHIRIVAFVLAAVVVYTGIELAIPVFTRTILNVYIPEGDLQSVLVVAGILLVLLIVYMVMQYLVAFYGHVFGIRMENDMRSRAFNKLQTLSFSYYDRNKTGQIMSRLTTDLREVSELAHHGIEDLLMISIMLVFGYIYLIQINFWATTGLFILTFVQLFLMLFARKNMIVAFRKLRSKLAQINSRVEGVISGVRLTRAFANEEFEEVKFQADNAEYMEAYRGAFSPLASTTAVNNFFVQLLSVAVLVVGAFLVAYNQIQFGDLVAYIMYFALLTTPIRRIMNMMELFQQGWAGFERFQELMDEPVEIKDRPNAIAMTGDVQGEIVFDHAQFTYNTEEADILKDFSLDIKKGTMVALVGPSGVGKTTIAQLIPRFYELSGGSITIDGVDIRDYQMRSLRRHIGYVQQDVIIFWGTIRDNIAYGNPEADDAAVIEAAKAAGIHDFIETLEDGYNTMVGERGVRLSGGQKQRLSLARIFLKNPQILILDEATSALDNITEAYIQQSIETLIKGRTVLVVAHRLTTVQSADEIIVLDAEGIVQRGTHQELLAAEGHYKNLYEASQNGIIGG